MTVTEKKVFKNKDLVLKVSPNVDPEKIDINMRPFFMSTNGGGYLKEAIKG